MKIKKYLDKIIIIILASIFIIFGYINNKKETNIENSNFLTEETTKEKISIEKNRLKETIIETIPEEIYVDISGCVINPGVYKLSNSKRIIDVIDIAGGLCPNADTSDINLSKKIFDEMKIHIKKIGETYNERSLDFDDTSDISEKNDNGSKININTASVEQLTTLPGIGEKKAIEIINYREDKKFKTIEDIKNISGIGDKTFEKIKDLIIVN